MLNDFTSRTTNIFIRSLERMIKRIVILHWLFGVAHISNVSLHHVELMNSNSSVPFLYF
jgi:hypothetical protein